MIYQHIVQNTVPISPKRFLALGEWLEPQTGTCICRDCMSKMQPYQTWPDNRCPHAPRVDTTIHPLQALLDNGWTGVHVGPDARKIHDKLESVCCEVGPDSHFLRLLDGYWVKCCTVEEIFNQFSGPYDLIWLDIPEKNRMLWYTRQIQDSRPTFYVMPDDNHCENVIKVGKDRGYWSTTIEERLVMTHPYARVQP